MVALLILRLLQFLLVTFELLVKILEFLLSGASVGSFLLHKIFTENQSEIEKELQDREAERTCSNTRLLPTSQICYTFCIIFIFYK